MVALSLGKAILEATEQESVNYKAQNEVLWGEKSAGARNRFTNPDYSVLRLLIVKGKIIPLQAWTGPEGSRRLRFPDFKTISTRRW